MSRLNLSPLGESQSRILDYLELNASDTLVNKINNGVKITKDDKTLINKKDLNGFMKFASEEARKTVDKKETCACIADDTVFGWAIHYFEEDSIVGKLYNEDGSDYKPPVKTPIPSSNTYTPKPAVTKPTAPTLFDFIDEPNEEKKEPVTPVTKPEQFIDNNTGEIFSSKEDSFLSELRFLFGESLEVIK